MSKKKCQRPDCKRKATVVIYRDHPEGRENLCVCQLDVQWAHKQLYPAITKPEPGRRLNEARYDKVEENQ